MRTRSLGKLADESIEKVDENTFGPLKALCEQAASAALPGRVTVLRPGYIAARATTRTASPTGRHARRAAGRCWRRMVREIRSSSSMCVILRASCSRPRRIHAVGTFNVVSPPGRFVMGDLVAASISCAKRLRGQDRRRAPYGCPWSFCNSTTSLWQRTCRSGTRRRGRMRGLRRSVSRARLRAGLTIRAIKDSVCDTLAWHLQRPEPERLALKAGIDAAREHEMLVAWHAAAAARPQ